MERILLLSGPQIPSSAPFLVVLGCQQSPFSSLCFSDCFIFMSLFVVSLLYMKWKWGLVTQSCPTLSWPHGHQIPLSMEFSRQEHWCGLPFLSPGYIPDSGIERGLLNCRQFITYWATGLLHRSKLNCHPPIIKTKKTSPNTLLSFFFSSISFCDTKDHMMMLSPKHFLKAPKQGCNSFWSYRGKSHSFEELTVVLYVFSSVQFSHSVVSDCLRSHESQHARPPCHHLPEFTQTHIHWVRIAIQPSHPGSSPSPPALNPFQHQSLFQWVNSSHEVARVLEFQL